MATADRQSRPDELFSSCGSGRAQLPTLLLLTSVLLLAGMPGSAFAGDQEKLIYVAIQTEQGDIEVELDAGKAPATVANFLRYVDGKFYNGGHFHRTVTADNQPDNKVKIAVIQAGIDPGRMKDEFPPIKLERTRDTKLTHKAGTISMARDGPDTATADFFMCVGDQPELDFAGKRNPDGQGFAAFGRVVKGMDVVLKIQRSPTDGQTLKPAIKIVNVIRKPPRNFPAGTSLDVKPRRRSRATP